MKRHQTNSGRNFNLVREVLADQFNGGIMNHRVRETRNHRTGNFGFTRRVWSVLLMLLAAMVGVSAQAPEDFGYGRIDSRGSRPLLVILTQFAGYPALSRGTGVYDKLVFNTFAPASDPSVNGYFIENSNGRFFWSRAGVVGPYNFTKDEVGTEKNGMLSRLTLALKAAAKDGFDFAQYDDNRDGQVTSNELGILVVDNLTAGGPATGGANRASDPVCFKPDGSKVSLCLRAALMGEQASLMTITHELLHSLGIPPQGDIYGSNDHSQGYTTMCATIYPNADDRRTFHLDPFHKMQLAWVEPKIHSILTPGSENIGAAQLVQGDQPVILYSPYNLSEYFILEYRTRNVPGGAGYEANIPGDGLLIWQVKVDANKIPVRIPSLVSTTGDDPAVFILGAPTMARGKGTAWAVGDMFLKGYQIIPYTLRWLSTVDTTVKIKVGRTTDNLSRLNVSWGNFTEPTPVPRQSILYYNDSWNAAAVGRFDEAGNHTTLSGFYPGNRLWTSVVDVGDGTFFYDSRTGIAMLASIDSAGNFTTKLNFPQGYFGAGWTHIVSHRGYLFFYCASNGMAAIGQISASGFRQFKGYPAYSFGLGWTHIVSTKGGLLFYCDRNGMGAVGEWDYVYSGYPGGFPMLTEVRFKQLTSYGAGSFSYGWSSIVETGNGVLFYRKSDGLQVMADVDSAGRVSTRSRTVKYLKPGYTGVVAAGEDILLYNSQTGDGALAYVLKAEPWVLSSAVGSLQIRREFPGQFATGWSHLTIVGAPTVIR